MFCLANQPCNQALALVSISSRDLVATCSWIFPAWPPDDRRIATGRPHYRRDGVVLLAWFNIVSRSGLGLADGYYKVVNVHLLLCRLSNTILRAISFYKFNHKRERGSWNLSRFCLQRLLFCFAWMLLLLKRYWKFNAFLKVNNLWISSFFLFRLAR